MGRKGLGRAGPDRWIDCYAMLCHGAIRCAVLCRGAAYKDRRVSPGRVDIGETRQCFCWLCSVVEGKG
eukprot:7863775-Pyramimonas_sp.AAC.1